MLASPVDGRRPVARFPAPLVAVALALAAPASGLGEEPAPPGAAGKFLPATSAPTQASDAMVGELIALPGNRSAAYGPAGVRGPKVSLTDAGNGEWKGNINDLNGSSR